MLFVKHAWVAALRSILGALAVAGMIAFVLQLPPSVRPELQDNAAIMLPIYIITGALLLLMVMFAGMLLVWSRKQYYFHKIRRLLCVATKQQEVLVQGYDGAIYSIKRLGGSYVVNTFMVPGSGKLSSVEYLIGERSAHLKTMFHAADNPDLVETVSTVLIGHLPLKELMRRLPL